MTQVIKLQPDTPDLDTLKQHIRLFADGFRRAGGELYGYAFLAGRAMLLAKPQIPHGNKDPEGGFQKWIEDNYPDISYRTAAGWMRFTEVLQEKSATTALFNSAPKLLTDGKLSEKDCEAVLKVVPEVMDGKTMTAFMRDSRLAKDPEKAGGFRPDAKALEKWLKANHPELAGTKFTDLPEPVQKAFKKQYEPEVDPKLKAEAMRERWYGIRDFLARELEANSYAEIFHTDDPAHVEFVSATRELLNDQGKKFAAWLKGQPKRKKRKAAK